MIDADDQAPGRMSGTRPTEQHETEHDVVTPGDPNAPAPTTHRPGDEEGPTRRDGSQRPPAREHHDDAHDA